MKNHNTIFKKVDLKIRQIFELQVFNEKNRFFKNIDLFESIVIELCSKTETKSSPKRGLL